MSAPAATSDDFDPTSLSMNENWALLSSHVFQKGVQLGAVVGTCAVAPIVCIRRKSFSPAVITNAVAKSMVVGTAIAGLMLAAKAPSMDQAGLEDRNYRLHYNGGQNRTDKFAQGGALLGALAGVALVSAAPGSIVGGAGLGTAFGIAAHLVTKEKEEKRPNAMIEELKQ